jgi:hypothetical protein
MNRITQEARRRQSVVKPDMRKGKSFASRMYGVSLPCVRLKKRSRTTSQGESEAIKCRLRSPVTRLRFRSEAAKRMRHIAFASRGHIPLRHRIAVMLLTARPIRNSSKTNADLKTTVKTGPSSKMPMSRLSREKILKRRRSL